MLAGLMMVTLAAASWGTWSLVLRPVGLPSTITTPIVFLVMAVVTLPFALRGPRVAWDRRTVLLLVANAVFDALNVIAFFGAMAYTTVAIAVLTHYVAPILIAILGPRFDKVPARGAGPAALIALAGLAIVLEPWQAPAAGATTGALLGVASACCYAGNVLVLRPLVERIGATRAMAYHAVIAAAVLAPFAIGGLGRVTGCDLALLAAAAATIGAGSGVVFALGLVRIGAGRAAVLTFAEPLVAVAVGALVWEETLHPLAAVGGALVLGAGIHVTRKAR